MRGQFQKRGQPGRAVEAIPAGPLEFLRHEAFSELDRHFALFLARLSSPAPPELALATIHNVTFLVQLTNKIRNEILQGQF